MLEKLRMWSINVYRCPHGARGSRAQEEADPGPTRAGTVWLRPVVTGAEGIKKRHVKTGDAPSNKTYGNCLLGFHCSQKHPPGHPPAGLGSVVAGYQQGNYQQLINRHRRNAEGALRHPDSSGKSGAETGDSLLLSEQSHHAAYKLAIANF
jgi:hypothetical protein